MECYLSSIILTALEPLPWQQKIVRKHFWWFFLNFNLILPVSKRLDVSLPNSINILQIFAEFLVIKNIAFVAKHWEIYRQKGCWQSYHRYQINCGNSLKNNFIGFRYGVTTPVRWKIQPFKLVWLFRVVQTTVFRFLLLRTQATVFYLCFFKNAKVRF